MGSVGFGGEEEVVEGREPALLEIGVTGGEVGGQEPDGSARRLRLPSERTDSML